MELAVIIIPAALVVFFAGWRAREYASRWLDRPTEPEYPPEWQAAIDDLEDQYEAARRQILGEAAR